MANIIKKLTDANNIIFDPTVSKLGLDNVQDAIDELTARVNRVLQVFKTGELFNTTTIDVLFDQTVFFSDYNFKSSIIYLDGVMLSPYQDYIPEEGKITLLEPACRGQQLSIVSFDVPDVADPTINFSSLAFTNLIDILEYSRVSIDGQTIIELPAEAPYTPGTQSLFIFIDGNILNSKQFIEDFSKTRSTEIKLVTPLSAGREIYVKYINYKESSSELLDDVIVSTEEPTLVNDRASDGIIWFNPETRTVAIYSSVESGFIDIAYRRDFDSQNVSIPMDGGSF